MRLRIFLDEKVDDLAENGILGVDQLEEGRVLDGVAAVAHGAVHVADGVANHAADARLRGTRVDAVLDGRIEVAGKEKRRIVATRTPFG